MFSIKLVLGKTVYENLLSLARHEVVLNLFLCELAVSFDTSVFFHKKLKKNLDQ